MSMMAARNHPCVVLPAAGRMAGRCWWFCLAVLLLLFAATTCRAHVVLLHPTPRTDNDYLYSFEDGVCNPNIASCNAFCGDPYSVEQNYPLTILPVGVPTTLRWRVTVHHAPLQYRLSLNQQGDGDNHFDNVNNTLAVVSNENAADPTNTDLTGTFSTTVTIPMEALERCSAETADTNGNHQNDPCVLQLYDLYYFVSCANVLLTNTTTVAAGPSTPASTTMDNAGEGEASSSPMPAQMIPSTITANGGDDDGATKNGMGDDAKSSSSGAVRHGGLLEWLGSFVMAIMSL